MARQDESFGVIPLSCERGFWEVYLIKHRHGRYWGFPKGHAEASESPLDAAKRELKEETNLDVIRLLQEVPLAEQYRFILHQQLVSKRVLYFVAEVKGSPVIQKQEISRGCWFSVPEAFSKVTHSEARSILKAVEKILSLLP